jgi:hypothetical protein
MPLRILPLITVCLLMLALMSGCGVAGMAAQAMPQRTSASYAGLQEQSVGVLVWADRGVVIDWDDIQLDLANKIQANLQQSKATELRNARFPWQPASVLRFMRDRPELASVPIEQVAPRMSGVTRLIYVEIEDFSTRAHASLELFRGSAVASMRVIEIAAGESTTGFQEDGIRVVFPKGVPDDGLPNLRDAPIYQGTLQTLADEITARLMTTMN